jgi:hypothetical protein
MRKKARTTSTLREKLVRARQNNDSTLGVESQTSPLWWFQKLPPRTVTTVTDMMCSSAQHLMRLE